MKALDLIRDKAKNAWRTLTKEEREEIEEQAVNPNRAMRRAWRTGNRRRGAGYTRAFHKGREQRPTKFLRVRQRALTPEQQHRLMHQHMAEQRRRNMREERKWQRET